MALTNTMPLADLHADLYGIGKKYSITTADIAGLGAFTTGTIVLDTLPAGAIIQLVRIKHSQSVAGPSISAATAQVQDSVNAAYGSALDVFQAVSATALSTVQLTSANVGNFATTTTIQLNLTSTGANLGVATAGAIDVWVRYVLLA